MAGNAIRCVPAEFARICEQLLVLDLSRNAIDSLDSFSWAACARLETLVLSANQLALLPDMSALASTLKVLRLAGNRLTTLRGIEQLQLLVELDASDNALGSLDWGRHADLAVLRLARNRLRCLPDDFGRACSNVRELTLAQNNLENLPASVGLLRRCTSLDLNQNRLTELPVELGAMAALASLTMDGNRLAVLPADVLCGPSALHTLSVRGNGMSEVPASVAGMAALATLDLSDNNLATLPPELSCCPSLRHVAVEGNALRSIRRAVIDKGSSALLAFLASRLPADHPRAVAADDAALGIGKLSLACVAATGALDLSGQKLAALPDALLDDAALWPALATVVLDRNALRALPDALGASRNLISLSAAHNRLECIPRSLCLAGAPLAVLNLAHNRLAETPQALAAVGRTLHTLNLSYNSGIALADVLGKLPALTTLSLCGCALSALPDGLIALSKLRVLELETNALVAVDELAALCATLDTLDLRNNSLMALPHALGCAPNLNAILFDGNPSRQLTRVAQRGTAALKRYLCDSAPA